MKEETSAPEIPEWDTKPIAPPGLERYMPTFLGWAFWICVPIGILAVTEADVMMALPIVTGLFAI